MAAQHAKPNFSQLQVAELVKRLFGLTSSEIHSLPSYDDQNFYVAAGEGGEFVLKIMNSEDSKEPRLIEMQTYAMSFLQQNGLPAQTALPTTSGQLMSLEKMDCGYGCQEYLVRLLTYLPGTTISEVPITPHLLYETGQTAARMDQILQKMEHPHLEVLQRDNFNGSLSYIPLLEKHIHVWDGDPLQEVLNSIIHQFKTIVISRQPYLRKCIIHGDCNNFNILVQPDDSNSYRISGILDFGDMSSGYYIYELAITIMHMMTVYPNPMEVVGPILAGWESVLPLNEAEKDCLYFLVVCRFCQMLVLNCSAAMLYPENKEYVLSISKGGDKILHELMELGKEQVEKMWFQSAAQYNDGQ